MSRGYLWIVFFLTGFAESRDVFSSEQALAPVALFSGPSSESIQRWQVCMEAKQSLDAAFDPHHVSVDGWVERVFVEKLMRVGNLVKANTLLILFEERVWAFLGPRSSGKAATVRQLQGLLPGVQVLGHWESYLSFGKDPADPIYALTYPGLITPLATSGVVRNSRGEWESTGMLLHKDTYPLGGVFQIGGVVVFGYLNSRVRLALQSGIYDLNGNESNSREAAYVLSSYPNAFSPVFKTDEKTIYAALTRSGLAALFVLRTSQIEHPGVFLARTRQLVGAMASFPKQTSPLLLQSA